MKRLLTLFTVLIIIMGTAYAAPYTHYGDVDITGDLDVGGSIFGTQPTAWDLAVTWGDWNGEWFATDAPSDGSPYGRLDGAWYVISAGMPDGINVNDIWQWDGYVANPQGVINGMIVDEPELSNRTNPLSGAEVDERIAATLTDFTYIEQATVPSAGDYHEDILIGDIVGGDMYFQTATGMFTITSTYAAGFITYDLILGVEGLGTVTIDAVPYDNTGSPHTITGFTWKEIAEMAAAFGASEDTLTWSGDDAGNVYGSWATYYIEMDQAKSIVANFSDSTDVYDTVKPTSIIVTITPGPYGLGNDMNLAYIYNAGTGTSIQDYVGTNDGTISGTTAWDTVNGPIDFLAAEDDVDLTSTITLSSGTSISLRIYQLGNGTEGTFFGDYGSDTDRLNQTNYTIRIGICSYAITEWHQYNTFTAVQEDSGDTSIYVNGSLKGSSDCEFTPDMPIAAFGSGYAEPDVAFGFKGLVDYTYVWDKALTAQQVADLHNHPYSMFTD